MFLIINKVYKGNKIKTYLGKNNKIKTYLNIK